MKILWYFNYLYRDSSNYKVFGDIFIEGVELENFENLVVRYLKDGIYFIPEQLDIPPLQREMMAYADEFPTEDDHVWHEFCGIKPATTEDLPKNASVIAMETILARLRAVGKWDETASGIYNRLYTLGYY